MVIIINAIEKDLNQIYAIELQSFDNPYPYSLLKAYLYLSPELYIVAKDNDDTILGYAIGIIQNNIRGHVVSIAVKRDARKQGIGTLLLKELEDRFKKERCVYSYLEVHYKNEPAISLYRKMGYYIVLLKKNYYKRGEHAYVMVKPLNKSTTILE